MKVEATLVNGMKITGTANVITIKSGEKTVEGPSLSLAMMVPAKPLEYQITEKVKAKVTLAGGVTVTVKPDWKALAKEAAKLLVEAGVVGALELAATMAVALGPALCAASALSMIADESELWQTAASEAPQAKAAAYGLARGTAMWAKSPSNPRGMLMWSQGTSNAITAIAKMGCTVEEYKKEWDFGGARSLSGLEKQLLSAAHSTYSVAIANRAREVYNASMSLRMWKTEIDFVSTWRANADKVWKDAKVG